MLLIAVPLAFTFICGLLALAAVLEQQRVRTTIRMVARSDRTTPEAAEALAALELAPVLRAHGFARG